MIGRIWDRFCRKKCDMEIQRKDKGADPHRARFHYRNGLLRERNTDLFDRANITAGKPFADGKHILHVNGKDRGVPVSSCFAENSFPGSTQTGELYCHLSHKMGNADGVVSPYRLGPCNDNTNPSLSPGAECGNRYFPADSMQTSGAPF